MKIIWDIYEIRSSRTVLHGVMLRGKIRKFSIENDIDCLVENATDKENVVRVALPTDTDIKPIEDFLRNKIPDIIVEVVAKQIKNPVLSKLKINDESRY